ncbi:murein L,D-transpeptidase family protein [Microvirga sp. CF3062]|uniref:murein L,D-transpeptidase family protein n=1 Tax=Microvirga sp. CF3062 TaxID=3110182 RepID=UPI002E771A98|nr:murein L,D-transpeptidase family protein [Microvirga sp. CF3062]MEE1656917.1 murein L,D-transpeptidase family protein [Microvirga sp. CF3062]
MMKRIALAASLVLALAACQDDNLSRGSTRHLVPIPSATMALMSTKGMSKDDPILVRAYKKESELEIWKRGSNGKYALLKTYPVCRWSGQLGPKNREGDRQVPEGFYTVTPAQMNPNSNFYLSFDTGYPNVLDRSMGRSGGDIMVHGSCSSRGCFAMTDQNVAEIYAIAREALGAGQRGFQFQSYPFRMTAENLAKHRLDPNIAFWKNLKEGADAFEVTKDEVQVAAGRGRYEFNIDPDSAPVVAQRRAQDEQEVAELVAKGEKPVKLVYHDGDTHESFRTALANVTGVSDTKLGYVSRTEGISSGPRVVALNETGKEVPEAPPTALAFASMKEVPVPQAETRMAVTRQTAPVAAAAAASEETPFYKKMFGGVADLFSTSSSQPVTETVQAAPVAPAIKVAPATKNVPQKRAEAAVSVKVANAN